MNASLFPQFNRYTLSRIMPSLILMVSGLLLLVVLGNINYLLFHTLSELFSIVIAGTIFVLTWNSRRFLNNGYLLVVGISFLFVGGIDLLHTVSYKGMDIFSGTGVNDPNAANLATQFWIAARYIQSGALVLAPFFMRRKLPAEAFMLFFGLISSLMVLAIFGGLFPVCYVDGGNPPLTQFKLFSEYAVILGYLVGIILLLRLREGFDVDVLWLIIGSLVVNIVAEVAFTQYIIVTGPINLMGHILKIISFYLIYKAIVGMGFTKPQELLFRELAQREAALRASESRERARAAQLEAIMDVVPAVVWIAHDPEARQVTGNQASSDLLRLPPNSNHSRFDPQVAGRFKFFDKQGHELSTPELALHIAATTGRPVREQEEIFVFEDGDTRHLYGNVTPLLDDTGRPAGAVAAFTDITGRVLAEQALAESERRYRTLFETMAEGFALVEVLYDGQGQANDYRFIEVNPAYERMINHTREQLVGSTIRGLLPGRVSTWIERIAEVARSGQAKRFEDISYLSNTYFEALISPVAQNICAVMAIDVTERHQSQEALRLSEARLRRLVDSNIIGIIFSDDTGYVSLANDAFLAIIGYTRADFEAGLVDWIKISPPEYLPLDRKAILEARERGACIPYEKEYFSKDGRRVPVLIGFALHEDNRSMFVCFVVDLTEQKRAEAAAQGYAARLERINADMQRANREMARANRELQDFAFVASHDLQEPLRKIQAFSERLKSHLGEQLDDESKDYLARMLNATTRMRAMIEDLLALSRVTTRGQPFEIVDLSAVADEVVSDLEVRIERSRGRVNVENLPSLEADPMQMHQLLLNLTANALKFHKADTPPVVTLSGECTDDDQTVIIKVEDNGIGFDEQYVERIFQPFQRLNGMGQFEGSGIGLAICRKIVERHSGTIAAHSQPGQGATFIISLPARQPKRSE